LLIDFVKLQSPAFSEEQSGSACIPLGMRLHFLKNLSLNYYAIAYLSLSKHKSELTCVIPVISADLTVKTV